MKKIKLLMIITMLLSTMFVLVGCGGAGGTGGSSLKAVEELIPNIEKAYNGLETIELEKFSLTYKYASKGYYGFDSNYDESESYVVQYDAAGYFYCSASKKVAGIDGEETFQTSHMWVDGSTLTYTYTYFKRNYNDNRTDKRYWVEEFSSHEEALEEFEKRFEYISTNNILECHPETFVLGIFDESLAMMQIYANARVGNSENKMEFTINSNTENGFDFSIVDKYEELNNDGNVWKSADSTYSIVVENGIMLSYVEDSMSFVNPDGQASKNETDIEFKLSLDWTFEVPDLSTYYQFN